MSGRRTAAWRRGRSFPTDATDASAATAVTRDAVKAETNPVEDAPDPAIGIGLVILGVLVMGVGGAATLHYVFNVGTAIAIIGALVFLVAVGLASLKERKLREPRTQ